MAAERWATFDCYGTLVDWNAGIGAELARLLEPASEADLLERYHAIEPRIQRERPGEAYREVMGRHYPPMSMVVVRALIERDALVEIEATALVP